MTITDPSHYFRLKKPCANCPFRGDEKAISLSPGRLEQIKSDLLADDHSSFDCHKTVYKVNSTAKRKRSDRSMCAGAARFLMQEGRPTVNMRLAFALDIIKPSDFS